MLRRLYAAALRPRVCGPGALSSSLQLAATLLDRKVHRHCLQEKQVLACRPAGDAAKTELQASDKPFSAETSPNKSHPSLQPRAQCLQRPSASPDTSVQLYKLPPQGFCLSMEAACLSAPALGCFGTSVSRSGFGCQLARWREVVTSRLRQVQHLSASIARQAFAFR